MLDRFEQEADLLKRRHEDSSAAHLQEKKRSSPLSVVTIFLCVHIHITLGCSRGEKLHSSKAVGEMGGR